MSTTIGARLQSLVKADIREGDKPQETSGQRPTLKEPNFPGIREADSELRELAWTFKTEKLFEK